MGGGSTRGGVFTQYMGHIGDAWGGGGYMGHLRGSVCSAEGILYSLCSDWDHFKGDV